MNPAALSIRFPEQCTKFNIGIQNCKKTNIICLFLVLKAYPSIFIKFSEKVSDIISDQCESASSASQWKIIQTFPGN